jgi:hypothetical protein
MSPPKDHLQQAQYLLNFYESGTQLRAEYGRDTSRALKAYKGQFSELPINNPSLPYGDLLEKSKSQFQAIIHKWTTVEERYRREDTSTTGGGPSETIIQQREDERRAEFERDDEDDQETRDSPPPPPPIAMANPTFDMQTFMQGFMDAINKGKDNGMKSSDVGYFYPDAPVDWGETSMVVHDGKTYYRDANAFASRLNVLSASKGWKNVSDAVDGCLYWRSSNMVEHDTP